MTLLSNRSPKALSLAEQIAEHVGNQIFRGEYQPGDAIPEQRISDMFRVSRGPVREALRILEKEGAVTIVPRRGAQVTKLSKREVVELYQIRAALFALATRLFVPHAQPDAVERLHCMLDHLDEVARTAEDAEEHSRISADMAQIIVQNCGNARLEEMINQLAHQIGRYTRLGLSTGQRRHQSVASWRNLIEAIRTGKAERASAVAQEMITNTQRHAETLLTDG